MIHEIFSDLSTFKNLKFNPGLNVLLADRRPDSNDRRTRNAKGKTSLVEIVHFLTGADCPKDSMFRAKPLIDSYFGMIFDVGNSRIEVSRSGRKPSEIKLRGELSGLSLEHKGSGAGSISNSEWRGLLGGLVFGLEGAEIETKYAPTFRSLFSYFARRQRKGGFERPEKNSSMQQIGDQQTAVTFLLGLDWSIPQRWQIVRERERTLKELRKAAVDGMFGEVVGSTADLRTRLVLTEERATDLRNGIDSFRVHKEYEAIEARADKLTRAISRLVDLNTLDRSLISQIEESTRTEEPPVVVDLEEVYKEVGVLFPDAIRARFSDARQFHESIIVNRRSYLALEKSSALSRILQREKAIARLDEQRSHDLQILRTHGALEHFVKLQEELVAVQAEVENLKQRYQSAEQFEGIKTELELERHALHQSLAQDYVEQASVLTRAIVIFEKYSSALYENPGSLTIDATINGPEFDVRIHGERSKGVNNMQIFCFDMTLVQLCTGAKTGPGFLIHDSHLFDGVDDRQIISALETGSTAAKEFGFQYIVTMNSDVFPKTESLQLSVLPVRLTDEHDIGGLFGVVF